LGFCANDGTLHIAFDHHNNTLNYIRSKKYLLDFPEKTSWKLSQFLPLSHQLDEEIEEVSYPSFVSMPDGNLQLFYRKGKSGDGQTWMATYKAQKSQWQERHAIDSQRAILKMIWIIVVLEMPIIMVGIMTKMVCFIPPLLGVKKLMAQTMIGSMLSVKTRKIMEK
jgi:hypothetical protein